MPSSRGFASYWASRDIAALGNGILLIGLLTLSYQAEESATTVSIVVVALLLPPFLLSPLADRLIDGQRAYPAALIAQLAFVVALLPLLTVSTAAELRLVLTAIFAAAIPVAFLKSARKALLPALVGEEFAAAEKALVNTKFVAIVAGPAAGTFLYSSANYGAAGFSTCVIAAIVALALSTVLLMFSRPTPSTWTPFETHPLARNLAELQKGLIYTWHLPALRTVATIQLIAALLIGGVVVVQVALMVWGIFTSAENLGLVLAAQGLGLAIATFGNRFLRRQLLAGTRIAMGFGLIAAGGFSFAISASLNGAVASGLVIGLGLGMAGINLSYLVGNLATKDIARPIWKGLDLAKNAAVILSATFLGRITDLFGPRYSIVLLAILFAVLALYTFGAAPDPDSQDVEKENTHPGSDTLYDIGFCVPAGTPLG